MQDFLFNISLFGASGVWDGLKEAISFFLQLLYQFTTVINIPSYALAIVLFTVIIKFALYPLTLKQMRSMRGMQKIQPLISELDKKYGDNPQKKQEEMFRIYKEYNVNPLSGCLPILIQFPILILLYRTLFNFVPPEGVHYSFLWIENLSLPDPTGWAFPVIVAAATFLQQKFSTVDQNNPTQKIMLYVMPIFFGFISRNFPAALSIYWITFSVMGGLQQYMVNKTCDRQDRLAAEAKALEEAENPPKKAKKPTELEKAIAAATAEKEAKAKAKTESKDRSKESTNKPVTMAEVFDGDHPYSRKTTGTVSTPEGVIYLNKDKTNTDATDGTDLMDEESMAEMPESRPVSPEAKNKGKSKSGGSNSGNKNKSNQHRKK
jgi:YidC/Oxa1 family membrane protein insertase